VPTTTTATGTLPTDSPTLTRGPSTSGLRPIQPNPAEPSPKYVLFLVAPQESQLMRMILSKTSGRSPQVYPVRVPLFPHGILFRRFPPIQEGSLRRAGNVTRNLKTFVITLVNVSMDVPGSLSYHSHHRSPRTCICSSLFSLFAVTLSFSRTFGPSSSRAHRYRIATLISFILSTFALCSYAVFVVCTIFPPQRCRWNSPTSHL
jgi:hypothetical protein